MITSKKLLKQKGVIHGFFNRTGGKSTGIYKSLNCGPGSKDVTKKVNKNLKIVKDKISKKSKNIFLMHQIHYLIIHHWLQQKPSHLKSYERELQDLILF